MVSDKFPKTSLSQINSRIPMTFIAVSQGMLDGSTESNNEKKIEIREFPSV